jgi:hypothetical protein
MAGIPACDDVRRHTTTERRLMTRLLLLSEPVVDGFDVEPPVTAHAKGGNLIVLQQPVDRARMHT